MIWVSPAGLMQRPERTPFTSRYWASGESEGPNSSSPVVGILDQEVEHEAGRLLHRRVGALAEERLVEVVGVALPEVVSEPGRAGGPQPAEDVVEGRGVGPEVGVVVGDEATAAVVHLVPSRAPVTRSRSIRSKSGS